MTWENTCKRARYKRSDLFLGLCALLPWSLLPPFPSPLTPRDCHEIIRIALIPPYICKADFNLQNFLTRQGGALSNDSVLFILIFSGPTQCRHTGSIQLICLEWMNEVLSHLEGTAAPLVCPTICLFHLVMLLFSLGNHVSLLRVVFLLLPVTQMVMCPGWPNQSLPQDFSPCDWWRALLPVQSWGQRVGRTAYEHGSSLSHWQRWSHVHKKKWKMKRSCPGPLLLAFLWLDYVSKWNSPSLH